MEILCLGGCDNRLGESGRGAGGAGDAALRSASPVAATAVRMEVIDKPAGMPLFGENGSGRRRRAAGAASAGSLGG